MRTPLPRHRALGTAAALTVAAVAVTGAFAACSASRDVTSPKHAVPVDGHLATLLSADSSLIMVGGRTYRLVSGAPMMPKAGEFVSSFVRRDTQPGGVPVTRTLTAILEPPPNAPRAQPIQNDGPYFEFQVEQPVAPSSTTRGPRYPDALRSAKVEGAVMAQFIVDTTGAVVPGTFKVLRSDHDLFTQAVRTALDSMHFEPARVGGRKVKQLVQQPFQFSLTR